MENTIKNLLISLNISTEDSFKPFYSCTRDRDDIKILKCDKSGVIILDRTDHIDAEYYDNLDEWVNFENKEYTELINECKSDDVRRLHTIEEYIRNKIWVDIGTGCGGLIIEASNLPKKVYAIEKQRSVAKQLKKIKGLKLIYHLEEINESVDVISLFHVLEHLKNPVESMKEIYDKLSDDGVAIIEIPHARDFLLSFLDFEPFKKFVFWSEHLILHTRQSVDRILREAGFEHIYIKSIQRYSVWNHMNWLRNKEPGGHTRFSFLNSEDLNRQYEQALAQQDMNDTLLIFAFKRNINATSV